MAPRSSQKQKTIKATNNASKQSNDDKYVSKYVIKSDDSDDGYVSKYAIQAPKDRTSSMESSSTTVNSDHDSKCSGSAEQGAPAPSEARTSLKSLKSKAKMFVPTDPTYSDATFAVAEAVDPNMMAMPCMGPAWMPSPAKDYLAAVITNTLGMELWDMNMMDFTGYNGEWCTAVEITVPELNASMCHLAASQDAEAIAAAKAANGTQVVQSLTQALKACGSDVVLDCADHRAQICVDVCPANGRTPCREFSHSGTCPRGGSCHYAHAMFESFMINLILAPLAGFGYGTETQAPQGAKPEVPSPVANKPSSYEQERAAKMAESRWQPKRAPKPVQENIVEKVPELDSPKADVITFKPTMSLSPESRRKTSSLSRQKWSDILDDSDEE